MGDVTFKINSLINKTNDTPTISKEEYMYSEFLNIKHRIEVHGYGEMIDYVRNNIVNILTSAVDKKQRALLTITDIDFLKAMSILGVSELQLTKEYVNRFNRVYRAYIINPGTNVLYNKEAANIMEGIAKSLNKRLIDILLSLNVKEGNNWLTEDLALWLVINRYSSTDERRNIRRMTRAMQHVDPSIMTEQHIVDIYAKTFNDQLTNLFCAIMTDKFDSFDNKDEEYVYSSVSNAMMDILESMDIDEIEDILMEYYDELHKSEINGRFRISKICREDYPKIITAIEELEDRRIRTD